MIIIIYRIGPTCQEIREEPMAQGRDYTGPTPHCLTNGPADNILLYKMLTFHDLNSIQCLINYSELQKEKREELHFVS